MDNGCLSGDEIGPGAITSQTGATVHSSTLDTPACHDSASVSVPCNVICASFVAAVVLPTKREFPRYVGGRVGKIIAFDVGDFIAKLREVFSGSFEHVVISNPSPGKHAKAFILGLINPFNRNVHRAVSVAFWGNPELSRVDIPDIREVS
jgi:hypothetical protein